MVSTTWVRFWAYSWAAVWSWACVAGAAAGGLEVCEQQPVLRSEQVAWVWLAVQQWLGASPFDDRPPQASQRVAEKLTVRVREIGSVVAAPDQSLRFRDSIGEVRRRHVDLPHAGMQPIERVCVLGWRDLSRRHRFVVAPQRDYEAVLHGDLRPGTVMGSDSEALASGNRAFDEYRVETLRRLEEEQHEFKNFLDRLRHAKDKEEFDQFMAQHRPKPTPPSDNNQPQG